MTDFRGGYQAGPGPVGPPPASVTEVKPNGLIPGPIRRSTSEVRHAFIAAAPDSPYDRGQEFDDWLRRERLVIMREALIPYLATLANPPAGWYTFGTHIDRETGKGLDVDLEFWGDDGGGIPLWERPRS